MQSASQEYGASMRDLLESSYSSRIDADVRLLGSRGAAGSAASVLAGSGGRGLEDLYGVSLPPGRDYSSGKGVVGVVGVSSWNVGYASSVASQMDRPNIGSSRLDDLQDDRDLLRPVRPPPRVCREPSFPEKEEKRVMRRSPPRRELLHRHASPVKERRREYICRIDPYSLTEVERDFPSVSKRYSRLYVVPKFSKLVVNWLKEELNVSFHTPVSFEHDALVEDESDRKESLPKSSDKVAEVAKKVKGSTVWNAKVMLIEEPVVKVAASFTTIS